MPTNNKNVKLGYCVICAKKLRKFKIIEDWDKRKQHKTCWKKRNDCPLECVEILYPIKYDNITGKKINNN